MVIGGRLPHRALTLQGENVTAAASVWITEVLALKTAQCAALMRNARKTGLLIRKR